jgi:hypothetical protein
MLEFDACVGGGEVPVCLDVLGIAVVLLGSDFVDEDLFVWDAAVEALGLLRQIEPAAVLWSVVPFEAPRPAAWPRGQERLRRVTRSGDVEAKSLCSFLMSRGQRRWLRASPARRSLSPGHDIARGLTKSCAVRWAAGFVPASSAEPNPPCS